jgi:hypothetical protein
MRRRVVGLTGVVVVVGAVLWMGAARVNGQMRYWSGQNVAPVFEGWERNPDGSFNFVFGYFNRNYEEALDILVGPDNNLEPGGPDQGQPTFFAPARQKFLFRVRVAKGWPVTKRLVWTLTLRGKTEKANAFLLPEWEINPQVMAMNGAGGGGGTDDDYNQAPVITVGPAQTVSLSTGATVVASVTDDGLPKPRAPRPGAPPRGPLLRVAWSQFRGPVGGRIAFKPGTSPVAADGKASTTATFTLPGPYMVLGMALDGGASATAITSVTVSAAGR